MEWLRPKLFSMISSVIVEEQKEVAVPIFGNAELGRTDIAGPDAALVVDAAHVVDVDVQGIEQVAVAFYAKVGLEPLHHKLAGRHHHGHTIGLTVVEGGLHAFFGIHSCFTLRMKV